jgi:hypothetical protein
MIKKYPDACEHLLDMGGAYQYKMDNDWHLVNLSRCLSDCDNNCPKKRNKRELSVGCWSIGKRMRERFIKKCIKERLG